MSPQDPHVELTGIGKRFAAVQALADVSLTIERGSIHALVGENGAGKSTLGKVIAGLVHPDAGTYRLDGEAVSFRSPRDALRRGVTTISQELTLVPRRTVLENVFLGHEPRRLRMLDGRAMRRAYRELTERAGFSLAPDVPVGALRVADQQKVEVLRAITRGARLIVFDEPTAALAGDEAARLFAIVRGLREQGATIIYVSHFLDEVLELSDTVTVLKDGRHVRTAPAAGETPDTLVTSMLGRSLDVAFPSLPAPPADAPVVCELRGVSRGSAVRDVDLTLRAGEILGVAGLVGSGRTELARTIFGAEPADAGTIRVGDRELRIRTPRDAMRAGIALVPEDRKSQGLLLRRSIAENVTLAAMGVVTRGRVIRRRRERRTVLDAIGGVGVNRRTPGAPVQTLSGGNQQKVMFAKWLLRPPRVLIVDEPTRGVDVAAKLAIYELLIDLARQGMAVLLISSELEEILGLAHRTLVMREGAVVAELAGSDLNEERIMGAAFGSLAPRAKEMSET